jgi:hypothetical protein
MLRKKEGFLAVRRKLFHAFMSKFVVGDRRLRLCTEAARRNASSKETAMDVRGYALTISIVAALCSGMAVPASALPNMTHAFSKREVAPCGGGVLQSSKHYRDQNRYQNSYRSHPGDAVGCYGYGPNSPWYPE